MAVTGNSLLTCAMIGREIARCVRTMKVQNPANDRRGYPYVISTYDTREPPDNPSEPETIKVWVDYDGDVAVYQSPSNRILFNFNMTMLSCSLDDVSELFIQPIIKEYVLSLCQFDDAGQII